MIERIAKLLYPEGRELAAPVDRARAVAETDAAMTADQVTLFEATFVADHCLARVDILRKCQKHLDVIEVKAKSFDSDENAAAIAAGRRNLFWTKWKTLRAEWREYLEDVTFQVLVLLRLFPVAVINPYLLMPDRAKSTRIDHLHASFSIEKVSGEGGFARYVVKFHGDADELRGDNFLTLVPVKFEVEHLLPVVREKAETFVRSIHPNLRILDAPISVGCKHCEFRLPEGEAGDRNAFRECWGNLAEIPDHLLDLFHVAEVGGRGGVTANALLAKGKASIFDFSAEDLVKGDGTVGENNKRQIIQIEYTRRNEEWVSDELGPLLRRFKFPLHFIDFETATLAVPVHAGMRPYEEVAFQWSCHRLAAHNAEPTHSEWINVTDSFPNFAFAESLMNCIGDEGTVFMWATHENTILSRIAEQLERRGYACRALKHWLKSIVRSDTNQNTRLTDLNAITLRHYFHPVMKGRTSVKKVCDAVWKTNPRIREKYPQFLKLYDDEVASPYDTLPPLEINGRPVVVAEGTGAIRAYEAMLYGCERDSTETKDRWRKLLLQYCSLDTLAR
jgi:hypothetical protein